MNVATTPERPTARSLLGTAAARDGAPQEIAVSVDRAFAQLLGSLARWVGNESARVLVERALDETRNGRSWLGGVSVAPVGGRCFAGLEERVDAVGTPELVEGMEELLSALIEVLARFIGKDLALQIVIRGWPSGPTAGEGGGAP